jgi:hypothetical protein
MLIWSLAATVIYGWARRRRIRSLLSHKTPPLTVSRRLSRQWLSCGFSIWLAGLQSFFFCRTFGLLVRRRGARYRVLRLGVLGLGLTLFGVTTSEYLLRQAGFRGDLLLKLSLLSPFLNVPYRTFLNAAIAHAMMQSLASF